VKVTVHGPNLSAAEQAKGDLHVHAAGCADNAKYRDPQPPWTIDVESYKELTLEVYPASDFNYDPKDWQDYASDVWLAPCLRSLPTEVAA